MTKYECDRCGNDNGKPLAIQDGHELCDRCFKEYMDLSNELYKYHDDKLAEWINKPGKKG